MAAYLDLAGYRARAGEQLLPMRDATPEETDAGSEAHVADVDRITQALADASGLCRGYLPKDLLTPEGAEVEPADIPARIAAALPGIVYALARFTLADGTTGGDDDIVLRGQKAAIAALERLASMPDRATVVATLEDGHQAGAYIPGIDDTYSYGF